MTKKVTLLLREYGDENKRLEILIEDWAVESVTSLALDLLRIAIKGRLSATVKIEEELDLDERIKKERERESKASQLVTGPSLKDVVIVGPASSLTKSSGSSKDGNAKSPATSASSATGRSTA